jgi:hypothetical protein
VNEWQPIETAPLGDGSEPHKIDLLGKTWLKSSDTFAFERFTDCYWAWASGTREPGWQGLPPQYRAVAWMMRPLIPDSWS